VVRRGAPDAVAAELAREACLAVTDRGYLRIQREWRARAARSIACPLVQVESDVVVPVESASHQEEYSAATLRPKLRRLLREFLTPLRRTRMRAAPLRDALASLDLDDIPGVVRDLDVDRSVPPVAGITGGAGHARRRLAAFVGRRLSRYHLDRNDPALDGQSGLGPYLHFGQISPLSIALAVKARRGPGASAFLEELIVRRELSMNFTHHNPRYDRFACLPAWCRATLLAHAGDRRTERYTAEQLESARTRDPYWNAAQREMVMTGRMHGYMRMYWGKKILEWSPGPEQAFEIALGLNNKYLLDGRDPNGFAGVAWCFGKHDRPWAERPVFGTVRCMNASGLRRKFDIDAYVRRIAAP
jgi:deoxyribodipyrimidine photo-lyase